MNTEQTEDHTAGLELKPRCGTFAQIMMGGQRKSVNPNHIEIYSASICERLF